MITIRLWGGLGNQLFQYAFAYSLSKKNKKEMVLDCRFFTDKYLQNNKRFTFRRPDILKFPLNKKYLYVHNKNNDFLLHILQNKYINKLIRIFPSFKLKIGKNRYYIKETRKKFIENIKIKEQYSYYFDGYWQNLRYLDDFKKDFEEQFNYETSKTNEFYKKHIEKIESASIHVRRGDLLKKRNKHLGLLEEEYYYNAIKLLKNKKKNVHFFIFTQDEKWVKEKFKNIDNLFIISKEYNFSDLEEFQLMKSCKHNIIANSTFSWWAAYLNRNKEKIIVSPKLSWGKNIIDKKWHLI